MDIQDLSIVNEPLLEVNVDTMLKIVTERIEKLNEDKRAEKKEKEKNVEEDQEIEAPPEPEPEPENIALTEREMDEVMYDITSIPRFWVVKDVEETNRSIDLIESKVGELLFPEGFNDEAVQDLQVAVFALMFGLDFESSTYIYPVYSALNMANDYIVSPTTQKSVEKEAITFEDILSALTLAKPPITTDFGTDEAIVYAKIVLYRFLLSRIGDVLLPTSPEEGATEVDQGLLMRMIPTSLLIDVGILSRGVEPTERDSSSYLTKFEKARLVGERAKEISFGSKIMTDPGDLTDPIEIAEKELRELVMPLKVCRKFPDGSKRIWCASSLAKARDEFYETLKQDIDNASIIYLYNIAVDAGYAAEARSLLLSVLKEWGVEDLETELAEPRVMPEGLGTMFIDDVEDIMNAAGISTEDRRDPIHIVTMLFYN